MGTGWQQIRDTKSIRTAQKVLGIMDVHYSAEHMEQEHRSKLISWAVREGLLASKGN